MVQGPPKVAFISHSTKDPQDTVRTVDQLTLALGLEPFIAHRDIPPSKAWRDEIKAKLATCAVFVALLTKNYKESDWCDQEAGFIVSRRDVVVVPIRVEIHSYGFLSDYQELPWREGPYVSSSLNVRELTHCLMDAGATNRSMVIEGLGVAPTFRTADMAVEAIVSEHDRIPLTMKETVRLAELIHSNDQVYKNGTAPALLAPILAAHPDSIAPEHVARLAQYAFIPQATKSYRRY